MTGEGAHVEYRFGRFVLQPAARRLLRDGVAITCPRLVFDLLHHLVEHRDRAVGRDELATTVWRRADVADVQIGQVVLRARRAVDDDGSAQHSIATVPGFGYHWVAITQTVRVDAAAAAENVAVLPTVAEHGPVPRGSDERETTSPSPSDTLVALPTATEPASDALPHGGRAAPSSGPQHTSTNRRPGLALLLILIAIAITIALLYVWPQHDARTPAPQLPAAAPTPDSSSLPSPVLLLPLRVDGRAEHAWLRLGGMDLIGDRLRAAGLAVPSSESVLAALATAGADVDRQRAALHAAFGDVAVVDGEATLDADGQWILRLVARRHDAVWRADAARQPDPVAAASAAADGLAAALGRTPSDDPTTAFDTDADWRRARAALLANEVTVARRILATSSRLAAQPDKRAVYLAQVDIREGRLADADTAMTRVLATLQPGTDDATRNLALVTRGATRSRLGQFDAAWRDFDAAVSALPPDAPALDRARALSGRGSSAVPSGRHDAALADMGQARSLFASAGDVFGTARVDANLGMLELYRARPAAALDHLDTAAERLRAFGARHEWQVVLTAQVQAHLALLQHADAAAVAEQGWSQRDASRDPEQRIDIALNRAQVLLADGRLHDASTLLAAPDLDGVQGAVMRVRIAALRADLAARQARWPEAATSAQAALAAWPAQGAEREREPLVRLAIRAALETGDVAAARTLAERAPSPFALPEDVAHRELGRAAWLLHQHDAPAALDAFRAALAAAEEGSVPATLAAVADAMVPVLVEHGQLDAARAVAGRVAPWAERDFDCALVQVRVLHAAGATEAWRAALATAQSLAGERRVPDALLHPPGAR